VSAPRFYAPDVDPQSTDTVLPADESHHLARVLRLVGGDEVVIFDGRGHEWLARVVRADREGTPVRLIEPRPSSPEPAVPIVLAQSVLKGDKMDGVVRDATMAGVAGIVPIVTERSLIRISTLTRAHAEERWRRVAVSSAKQCRRSRLPEIHRSRQFLEWLETPSDGPRLLLVEPESDAAGAQPLRAALAGPAPRVVCCIVGPEGGWTSEERAAAGSAGCLSVTLGPMTLRADAVGLIAISLVSFAMDRP
jgi:16S rRNA (uracil1498-N3)-methyltransferase